MQTQRNIILCGYMGSGKSTLGRGLAAHLELPFVDLDDRIVQSKGMSIPEIFEREGEGSFRDAEHRALRELTGVQGHVIAVGGGTMQAPRNRALLRDGDQVLLLNPGFRVCYQRIKNTDRPLVRRNTVPQLRALYEERMALYRTVATAELSSVGSAAQTLAQALRVLGEE